MNNSYPVPPTPPEKKRKRWPWVVGGVFGVFMLIGILAPSEEKDQPAAEVPTTTVATTTAKPTPSTTATTPPPTTSAVPSTPVVEPEPVLAEDEANIVPAPLIMQPEPERPPVRQPAPEPVAPPPPAPVVAPPAPPAPPATSSYYKNCAEARAAGAAPMYEGSPGYRPGLDGDKDGIACDK